MMSLFVNVPTSEDARTTLTPLVSLSSQPSDFFPISFSLPAQVRIWRLAFDSAIELKNAAGDLANIQTVSPAIPPCPRKTSRRTCICV